VLRDFPKDSRALELETVIKSIESAKIAFAARNWSDAVRLLEKAREAYPKSDLISVRLAQAQKEGVAQQSLAKAKDAIQHKQYDMAQGLLVGIVTNSVYYTEAREWLDKIDLEQRTAGAVTKLQASYREGNLTEALTTLAEIEKGSGGATAFPILAEWRDRLRKMEALTGPLASAEGLKQEDSVEALLQGRKTSDEVLGLEQDPLNTIRRRAAEVSTRLTQWLQSTAQAYTAQAADLLKSGNRKEAVRLLTLAVKADGNNKDASAAMSDLRKQIVLECKSLYQKGIVHEELGQADLAREAFKKVLDIGLPGEEYFEKATRKLK
jgi:tetratricopeptide (TPR) repeat protein